MAKKHCYVVLSIYIDLYEVVIFDIEINKVQKGMFMQQPAATMTVRAHIDRNI